MVQQSSVDKVSNYLMLVLLLPCLLDRFYTGVIRSVLEYAAPVWHSSLTTEQKDSLENVQKRAILIICGERFAHHTCSYQEFCCEVGSLSLADRREGLSYNLKKNDPTRLLYPSPHS